MTFPLLSIGVGIEIVIENKSKLDIIIVPDQDLRYEMLDLRRLGVYLAS